MEQPAPLAAQQRGRWRVSPRLAFALTAAGYLVLCAISFLIARPATQLYFDDYWEHRAIIAEVIRHGSQLLDPIYGEAASSRQYTPWSLLLGYAARATGAGVDTVLAWGGLLVSVLFVIGVHGFAQRYYRHRWGTVVLLLALTCAWGVPSLIWTGFHSLRSQIHSNYYPASVVFALTFFAWDIVLRLLRAEPPGRGAQVLLGLALIVLVAVGVVAHPLNAAFLLAGAGALAVLESGGSRPRRAAVLALLAGGVLASSLWPFFNPLSLASAGVARGQATFNNYGFFFAPMFVVALLWPAGFALAVLPAQARDPRTRTPVVALVVIFAAYVAGGLADVSVSHRFLDYVVLALQLMLTWLVLDAIDRRPPRPLNELSARGWRVAGWVAATIIVLQVGFAVQQFFQPWAATNYPYPVRDVDAEARRVRALLPDGARVMGWNNAALVLPAYGVRVVSFPRPMPLSPSDPRRQAAGQRFFQRGVSGCERRAIAAHWGAGYAVYLANEVKPGLQRDLQRTLGPARSLGLWRIVRLPGPCASGA